MTKYYSFILRHIFEKLVTQGSQHTLNIAEIFRLLRLVVENEFTEDNPDTLNQLMSDCFELSQKDCFDKHTGYRTWEV